MQDPGSGFRAQGAPTLGGCVLKSESSRMYRRSMNPKFVSNLSLISILAAALSDNAAARIDGAQARS